VVNMCGCERNRDSSCLILLRRELQECVVGCTLHTHKTIGQIVTICGPESASKFGRQYTNNEPIGASFIYTQYITILYLNSEGHTKFATRRYYGPVWHHLYKNSDDDCQSDETTRM